MARENSNINHRKAAATARHPNGTEVQTAIYDSPLPAPEDMRVYSDLVPSAPERILTMAEKEQEDAIKQGEFNRMLMAKTFSMRWVGLFMSFFIVLFGMAGGFFLLLNDKPLTGFAAMGAAFFSTAVIMAGNANRTGRY